MLRCELQTAGSGHTRQMVYFALQMHWSQRRTYGSTLRAGPPAGDIARARKWRDTEPAPKRENSKQWIVGITDEELIAALGPTNKVVVDRVNRIADAIETMDSPQRVDMGQAALIAWPDETAILMEALDDLTARRERHHHSKRLRAHWAAQLLLRTSHLAGAALSTGDRWPCTWTNPVSTAPGRLVGRGRRNEQLGLLRWRSRNDRWPRGNERVAYWWSHQKKASRGRLPSHAAGTVMRPASARAAGSGL